MTPYPKRIRVVQKLAKLNEYVNIDTAWIISLALGIKTPMWVGYNVQLCNGSSTLQIISVLPPINESLTNVDVVEYLRCEKVTDECGQEYIEVSIDMSIAKIVFRILSTELRDQTEWYIFRRVFPHMGIVHIELSLLKAFETYIADSGFTKLEQLSFF